jgi:hypothetical protein
MRMKNKMKNFERRILGMVGGGRGIFYKGVGEESNST